jgi:alpha-glucosidase
VLELHIYRGEQANSFTWYEDDGLTYNYESGEYCKRTIRFDPVRKTITLSAPEGRYPSKFTSVRLVLHGFGDLMKINAAGKQLTLKMKPGDERFAEFGLLNSNMEITY